MSSSHAEGRAADSLGHGIPPPRNPLLFPGGGGSRGPADPAWLGGQKGSAGDMQASPWGICGSHFIASCCVAINHTCLGYFTDATGKDSKQWPSSISSTPLVSSHLRACVILTGLGRFGDPGWSRVSGAEGPVCKLLLRYPCCDPRLVPWQLLFQFPPLYGLRG